MFGFLLASCPNQQGVPSPFVGTVPAGDWRLKLAARMFGFRLLPSRLSDGLVGHTGETGFGRGCRFYRGIHNLGLQPRWWQRVLPPCRMHPGFYLKGQGN